MHMINKCLLGVIVLLTLQSCGNKTAQDLVLVATDENRAEKEISMDSVRGGYLKLNSNSYDFGKISDKKTRHISIKFEIENIGKAPLVIIKSDVSCGCLAVDYPKEPIMPNEKTNLTVNVDLKAQDGVFNKVVFIKSNADNDVEIIRIVGEVKI